MKQRRKLGRKILSFLLTLAMVIGMMPGTSMTSKASTTQSGTDTFGDFTYGTETYTGNHIQINTVGNVSASEGWMAIGKERYVTISSLYGEK